MQLDLSRPPQLKYYSLSQRPKDAPNSQNKLAAAAAAAAMPAARPEKSISKPTRTMTHPRPKHKQQDANRVGNFDAEELTRRLESYLLQQNAIKKARLERRATVESSRAGQQTKYKHYAAQLVAEDITKTTAERESTVEPVKLRKRAAAACSIPPLANEVLRQKNEFALMPEPSGMLARRRSQVTEQYPDSRPKASERKRFSQVPAFDFHVQPGQHRDAYALQNLTIRHDPLTLRVKHEEKERPMSNADILEVAVRHRERSKGDGRRFLPVNWEQNDDILADDKKATKEKLGLLSKRPESNWFRGGRRGSREEDTEEEVDSPEGVRERAGSLPIVEVKAKKSGFFGRFRRSS